MGLARFSQVLLLELVPNVPENIPILLRCVTLMGGFSLGGKEPTNIWWSLGIGGGSMGGMGKCPNLWRVP